MTKLQFEPYPEFRPEKRRWMFWLARLLGKKIYPGVYMWRGQMWICSNPKGEL